MKNHYPRHGNVANEETNMCYAEHLAPPKARGRRATFCGVIKPQEHIGKCLSLSASIFLLMTAIFCCDAPNAYAGSIFKTYQIQASSDDAEENKSDLPCCSIGEIYLNEIAIQIPYDKDYQIDQLIGLRFNNVDIPDGATLKSAHLRFFNRPTQDSSGNVNLVISGEATANPTTFTSTDYNLSSRPKTAGIAWTPEDWGETWTSEEKHKTADITPIINELRSQHGFTSGNSLAFFIESNDAGTNTRVAHSYDYETYDRMPRLTIEYEAVEPACDFTPNIFDNGTFLPDYSYAGYKWGEEEIPTLAAETPGVTFVDVTQPPYNVTVNDGIDDTAAINQAIADYQDENIFPSVVIHFPAGTYNISDVITIDRSHFVLQGEGAGNTIFQINNNLSTATKSQDILDLEDYWTTEVDWPEDDGRLYSLYTYTGGFFYAHFDGNRYSKEPIADVISGNQGDKTFVVSDSDSISVGTVVNFEWANDSTDSFMDYFVDGDCSALNYGYCYDPAQGTDYNIVSQPVTIIGVDTETNTVTIKEPLMHGVGPWSARLRTSHFLENVGFENFSVNFPYAPYEGHHFAAGYNALYLTDLNHSWVRNVSVDNADSGIIVEHSKNSTVENITSTGRENHYNIMFARSYGLLANNFNLEPEAEHNPSFNTAAVMSVFKNGYVKSASFDQHNGLNHQNLFENITVGYADNLFEHGGSSGSTPTAGRYNTFWNIKVYELPYNQLVGTVDKAPGARIVGLYSPGNTLSIDYSPTPYTEGLNQCIDTPSLYDYQLQERVPSDTTSPVISEVTPVTTPTTDYTPDYTFNTDEAGEIIYGGSCSSATSTATVGDNTITFAPLAAGIYTNCTIMVKDKAENGSNLLIVSGFEVLDTTPDDFSLIDLTDAELNTEYYSNQIIVTGLNTATPISISNGEYQINSGAWTSANGIVHNDDTVKVRLTSSASFNTRVNADLVIGGGTETFSIRTKASPSESVPGSVISAPHNKTNNVKCGSCHSFSLWWQYSPINAKTQEGRAISSAVCHSCHDGSHASIPIGKDHSSNVTGTLSYTYEQYCVDCHDPHKQSQLDWKDSNPSELYLITGSINSVAANVQTNITEISYSGAPPDNQTGDWTDRTRWGKKNNNPNFDRGLIFVVDTDLAENSYQVLSATSTTLTVKGIVSSDDSAKSFGLIYGQFIKSAIATPESGVKQVKFFNPDNGGLVDIDPNGMGNTTGLCQVCHTETTIFANNGGGPVGDHASYVSENCTLCHTCSEGFKPAP